MLVAEREREALGVRDDAPTALRSGAPFICHDCGLCMSLATHRFILGAEHRHGHGGHQHRPLAILQLKGGK